ncbi:MAG: alpha/beta fold hydrolase [Bacteroidetes bacterium]|nr:MAG: alpha/beta fold hydrolase [Bacteroidota bacterium]TAG90306.1 MAG: alpha/beta fold hydrolase [Bacteroidota bacterium]
MQLFHRKLSPEIIKGNEKNIIILHGLFGTADNWFTIGKKLAEKNHIYLIDQRNHGQSGWSDEWNYNNMSEDLNELIDTNRLQDVVVIGHSMGGKTAMLFAGQFPEKLSQLIVIDISPRYYPPHHSNIIEALKSIDLKTLNTRQEAEKLLENKGLDVGTRQFLLKNLYRKDDQSFAWRMNLEVISQKIEKVGEEYPQNFSYEGSTIFIRGDKSNYINLEHDVSIIKNYFPNAEILSVKDAGHWVHAEQPQALLKIFDEFIL